jgi:AcrR family transcriptional regulator
MKEHGDGEAPPPGRTARSQRTREAVVDALLDLLRAGETQPGAAGVAERAGVSTRTVFAHFASLEDLYRAGVERATARVLAIVTPIDPALPLPERIAALCEQRARVNEDLGPIRRAAALRAPSSPALTEAREFSRRASFEQLDRVFGAELGRLDEAARRRRRAAADAAVSGETWHLLRAVHGLSRTEARAAVEEAVRPLLTPEAEAEPGAVPAGAALVARREAAERALADVERKVGRLVAAIEAGSPGDLIAPRLQALRAARADAERELDAVRAAGSAS